MISLEQIHQIMPRAKLNVNIYLEPLRLAMDEFEINTPQRQAAFLAQIAHESGELRFVKELASGAAYEGRADLGNIEPGDGVRYKGRGLIQITGRTNYAVCSTALCGYPTKLLNEPELLEQPDYACRSAAWFWKENKLNELADAGNFRKITIKINGGLNHYENRVAYFELAKEVLA